MTLSDLEGHNCSWLNLKSQNTGHHAAVRRLARCLAALVLPAAACETTTAVLN